MEVLAQPMATVSACVGSAEQMEEVSDGGVSSAGGRILLTHFIVSNDVERSRRFYADVLGGETVRLGEPSICGLGKAQMFSRVLNNDLTLRAHTPGLRVSWSEAARYRASRCATTSVLACSPAIRRALSLR